MGGYEDIGWQFDLPGGICVAILPPGGRIGGYLDGSFTSQGGYAWQFYLPGEGYEDILVAVLPPGGISPRGEDIRVAVLPPRGENF